jgi:DNA polymerase-1
MGTKAVIIDGKNMLYRANYSNSGLQYKGQSVSALYGFLQILGSVIRKLKPDYVIICWDGLKKHPARMKLLPNYKKRDNPRIDFDAKAFYAQEDAVRKMVAELGIPQIWDKEMEADDYIYHFTRILKKKYDKVYIVSADKDFNQLISKKVWIWDDRNNKLIHHKNLEKEKGYTAAQCVDYLSLIGDKSDNIPGYKGVGEKTAIAFLEKHSIEEYVSNLEIPPFKKVDRTELRKIWKVNREMIDLKYFYLKHLKGKLQSKAFTPEPDKKKFIKLCKKYGFKSFQLSTFVNPILKIYESNNH